MHYYLYVVVINLLLPNPSGITTINLALTSLTSLKYSLSFFAVFTSCGAHEQALSSFQKSGNWRQVFCMASLLQHTGEQVVSLARTVAGVLLTSLVELSCS